MAPLVPVLSGLASAIVSALVVAAKWIVDHLHIVKIVVVCTLIVAAFKAGRYAYNLLVDSVGDYISRISDGVPTGLSASASFLAKANYVLPISEMFALLSVYVTLAGLCLGLKCVIAGYKAIPFKSA